MKNLILTICLLLIVFQAISQAPVIDWQSTLGGTDYDTGTSIVQTNDGGYIMAGAVRSSNGTIVGNHGDYDYIVVKYSNTGTIQWQKLYGGSQSDEALSIIQTSDGGYIIAGRSASSDGDVTDHHPSGASYVTSDYWVVKITNNGTIQWSKSFGGAYIEFARSIIQTSDGGYAIAGTTFSGPHGNDDYLLIKISDTGNFQWQKFYGGSNFDHAYSVIQTIDGGYSILGNSESNNGDVVGHHGGIDMWMVKTDASGNLQWQKPLGGSNSDYGDSIIQTNDGNYYLTGSSTSTNGDISGNHGWADVCVFKLNSSGTILWQKSFGGTDTDYSYSIIKTSDANLVIAASSWSSTGDATSNKGGSDFWVIKINSAGNILWQKSFGGTNDDVSVAICQTSDGGFALTGSTKSNDADVVGFQGYADIWTIKLSIVPFSISPTKKFAICQSTATITSAGCSGTVNWYRDVDGSGATNQFLASGSTLTYTTDANWRQYIRATCTVGSVTSPLSNYCTVQTGPEIDPISYIVSPNIPFTLNASGCPTGTTYLWATGETTQSITKSTSAYTLYFVRCVSNTCQSADGVAYISVGNVIANNDTYNLNIDTPVSGNFCNNDGTLPSKTIYVDYPPVHGSVVWDNTGAFTYTPTSSYSGTDSFTYYLTNGVGGYSNYATVVLNIICPTTLPLSSANSPSDDFSTGVHKRQASSYNGIITATNKITGTANVKYLAKSIRLNAGFKADNGTVFKAEVGGCY